MEAVNWKVTNVKVLFMFSLIMVAQMRSLCCFVVTAFTMVVDSLMNFQFMAMKVAFSTILLVTFITPYSWSLMHWFNMLFTVSFSFCFVTIEGSSRIGSSGSEWSLFLSDSPPICRSSANSRNVERSSSATSTLHCYIKWIRFCRFVNLEYI